jgi:DNA mismatch repair protein MutS
LFAAVTPPLHAEPAPPDEIRAALAALDLDDLSPKAALDTLYKLRKLMESRK